jgi:3-oxoacyl-[acyl-carrier protein] reductase
MRANRFAEKTVLITGGAGGLGAAIAAAVVEEGGRVAILDTNQSAIDQLLIDLRAKGAHIEGQVVDVRDGAAVTLAIDTLANSLGGIDALIAAAGGSLGTPRDLADISDADLDLVIDVNVKGTFYCARAVIPHLKAKGGGAIVTFSSIGGRSASPVTGVPYAAAKAAILGITRRLAKEVGEFGIRVNAIAPGLFLTDRLAGMFENMSQSDRNEVLAGIPLGRMPELRECVEPVLFLASQESSYITGAVLDVNGGRLMPN